MGQATTMGRVTNDSNVLVFLIACLLPNINGCVARHKAIGTLMWRGVRGMETFTNTYAGPIPRTLLLLFSCDGGRREELLPKGWYHA